jgi:hypothetical protein
VKSKFSIFRPSSSVLLILTFCLFVLAPLTAPGYFMSAHDARHSVYFLRMFDMSIQDGAWFPRWATDMVFGYGYPLWLILAPLPFFTGEIFHLIGFDFVASVKIVDGLALFCSALTMYLYASRVLGKHAGLVAGIAYAYIPYHLVDLYVRAAQAELVSFVFPPLILWAFHQLATTRQAKYIPIAAFAYAGLVLSHMSMTALFTPVIGLYLIFLFFQQWTSTEHASRNTPYAIRFAINTVLALTLAVGIAAIFVIPVLFEQRFLTTDPLIGGFFNYRKHFLNASQLLSPFWGYGYAGENGNDQFSLQLGLIPVLLTLVALFALKSDKSIRIHILFFVAALVGLCFLMLPISAPVWEPFASIAAFAQFPWRLLIVSAVALAFLSGAALHAFPESSRDLASILITALIIVTANYAYTQPQHSEAEFNYVKQMEFEVKDRELLGDTIWMTGDRPQDSPLVQQYIDGGPLQKAIALDGNATVTMLRHGGQSDEIRVDASVPARIMFYTRYFPGWTATVDGQPLAIEPYGEQGLILVHVPPGSHNIKLRFEDTPVRQIAALISGISILIACIWWWKVK